jgi:hypothetical protein
MRSVIAPSLSVVDDANRVLPVDVESRNTFEALLAGVLATAVITTCSAGAT